MAETEIVDVPTLPTAKLHTFTTREDWLRARGEFGIGSSDVPAILGISRFQSPLALYHRKLGVEAESEGSKEFREWGLILEEPIAQRYALKTGRKVLNPNRGGVWSIAQSTQYPWMVASCDRFAEPTGELAPPRAGVGVVEIKNAHLFIADMWGPDNNNEPPVEYQVQAQHQLAVTGLQWCSIVALIGGVKFIWADIPRDEELIAKLIEIEGDFMRRLEQRDPPPADGSDSTTELLKKLYPRDVGTSVELPVEAIEWHNERVRWKAIADEADKEIKAIDNKLKAAIGEHTVGVIPGHGSYSYKLQQRAGYTVEPTEFRVLRHQRGK